MKWKVAPQHAFCATWEPAVCAWRSGRKVRKAIGFDSGVKDCMRYAEAAANAHDDSRYEYIYPIRDWGWDRDRCIREIIAAGLSAPAKSACFCCPSTKPAELHDLEAWQLRTIVVMETRAKPYLKTIEGLWRRPTKGVRGAVAKPGDMTRYIREHRLLEPHSVDELVASTPKGQEVPVEVLDAYLEVVTEGRKL
jgi:hypothetical protein